MLHSGIIQNRIKLIINGIFRIILFPFRILHSGIFQNRIGKEILLLNGRIVLIGLRIFTAILIPSERTTADYFYFKPFYTAIPKPIFLTLCLIAELLTAYKIGFEYLSYSIYTAVDISSIENCILAFSPRFDFILQFIDPMYYGISKFPYFYRVSGESEYSLIRDLNKQNIINFDIQNTDLNKQTITIQNSIFGDHNLQNTDLNKQINNGILKTSIYPDYLPCLNGFWYHNMAVIDQFYPFTSNLIFIWATFFISIKPNLLFIFKPQSNFKNYLLLIRNSNFISLYFSLYLSYSYLTYLFSNYQIVNTNFLYWNSLIFILLFLYDQTINKNSQEI